VRTEHFGQLHVLWHAGLADALEDIILGDLAADWQCATLRCNGLDLCPKRDLII
jgi:hypothetical protein